MMGEFIWITWENQRRNREISCALGATLYELKEIDAIRNPWKKYIRGLKDTIRILFQERPEIVFCQNPSLVLAAFMVTIKNIMGIKVCVDAHNAGLFPQEGRSYLLGLLSRYIQRRADLTIVTNEGMRNCVEKNHGRAFILPDKIPAIPLRSPATLKGKNNILFICSYADDEPYEQVFKAAGEIDPQTCIYVTGNYHKRNIDHRTLPVNVILMGYVTEEEYITMLNSVDATIDLTTRENCLVCGAYETVAVGKPLILSNTQALRSYFNRGAVYTPNSAEGICKAIKQVVAHKEQLSSEVRELKTTREAEWEIYKAELDKVMSVL